MKKVLLIMLLLPLMSRAQELYDMPEGAATRWISFENPTGAKGRGAMENKGGKGHPCDTLHAGGSKILADIQGAGIINRIWITISNRSPAALRSIRIEMYWDGATKPAVAVPLGDFFGVGLGRRLPFQNVFFSDPEGRSFNCNIPMPFNKRARIVLINECTEKQALFYDVNLTTVKRHTKEILYFHAYWSSNAGAALGQDFSVLPKVSGKGRYLGANFGITTDKSYSDTWVGEGEVKMYLDGDTQFPTLAGTGTEDYIGTAWGQGVFAHMYQGCPIADKEKRQYAFYRYHVPDPVYFQSDCHVIIQPMGGGTTDQVRQLLKDGARLKPVSVSTEKEIVKLLEMPAPPSLESNTFPNGWVNFYRVDDYSATAYFYLDKPENGLPALAPLKVRLSGL